MRVADEIESKLRERFAPAELEVEDQSALHAGHAGAPEGGQSHFAVTIRAKELADMSRIARHRAIHAALGTDLVSRIHALAIDAG
ncbi:transcriptional regulator BolA [Rhodobacteraceae bacterium THAF1]|uniref:BolA family protein n=1 Tax=Palleronia sp. THAF1 TaxID=2587842 RepID=UPI000F3DFF08|nr:BolA family protein [Palleronia sp. THAF1]QFU09254.1 transcriptional regulator BolA [Palleronia sp. THAF1]VDC27381.1 transcriptional regulator BolA [Rhodobacteraceae bacterium THAF1]